MHSHYVADVNGDSHRCVESTVVSGLLVSIYGQRFQYISFILITINYIY